MSSSLEIQKNVRDLNRKKKAESKINDLENQLKYLRGREQKHRAIMEEKQSGIDKLQGRSLSSMMMASSKKKALLDKERREAYEAAIDYESIVKQIKAVEADLESERKILQELEGCEERYQKGMEDYRQNVMSTQSASANEITEIEHRIAHFQAQQKEIQEAIVSCREAKVSADAAYEKLSKAKGKGGLFGGSLAKRIDEAQKSIQDLLIAVRRFKNELGDVQEYMQNTPIKTERFLKFADYFFDDVFLESQESFDIVSAQMKVEQIRWKLEEADEKLSEMMATTEKKKALLKNKIDGLVVGTLF